MIYGSLSNLSNTITDSEIYKTISDSLNQIESGHFITGKQLLSEDVFALFTEYITDDWQHTPVESHLKNLDLVILIEGKERLWCRLKAQSDASDHYDKATDTISYQPVPETVTIDLYPGAFILFEPQDIHHPGGNIKMPTRVKKVTYKIRIKESEK